MSSKQSRSSSGLQYFRWPMAIAIFVLYAQMALAATFLTGTGGTTSKFKDVATGTDLVCDLSNVPIEATVSPARLVLGGLDPAGAIVMCDEVDPNNSNTVLRTGQFKFSQIGELVDCLTVQSALGQTTWTCKINSTSTVARWKFTPVNGMTDTQSGGFCENPVSPGNFFPSCYAEHGTPDSPLATDFPAGRDVVGNGDPADFLGDGEVLTFTTPSGRLLFGPCHSGTFKGGSPVLCSQGEVDPKITRTQAGPTGVPDADGVLPLEMSPTPLNLNNKSVTAGFPAVIFGADGQLNVATINLGAITFRLVGLQGAAQPLRVKSAAAKFLPGPSGAAKDALQDLQVKFDRADLINGIKAITGAGCPNLPATLSIQVRGYFGSNPANGWTAIETVEAFNCAVN